MPKRPPFETPTLSDKTKSASHGHVRGRLLREHWDFLAVLLLIVVSLPVIWLSPKTIMVVPHPGLFDDHWDLDAVYRAAHGSWFGRDVAFPYGPIFEWLFSAPARWANLSFTAIYASYNTLLLWCTFLFGYFTLRLLLPEQPNWKRFLLLILLCVFWAPWDGRTAFDIFLFALFLRGWYGMREKRVKPILLGSAAAVLCAIAFLYSADTGVYGIAAFGLAMLGVAWESWRDREALRRYVITLVIFAAASLVMVFVINLLMGGLGNFQFWRSSLALVSVHRWNEPSAMASDEAVRLLGPLVAGAIIFLLRWLVRGDRAATIAARPGFLLSAFVFAVLAMQSGLIRSDPMHVVFAVFCMVFFSGVVLFSFAGRIASGAAALLAVVASLFAGLPTTMFRPSSLHYRLAQFRHPSTDCPAGFNDFHDVCYPSGFTALLDAGDRYLNQHSGRATPS